LIRVWIETSSPVARAGFESLLRGSAGIELADSVQQADVILSDDPPDGPELPGSLPLVVLSDEPITALALRWGVRAMLHRGASAAQIVAALQAAGAGLIVVPAQSGSSVIQAADAEGDVEALTPREMETFEMLAEGFSNKQIAAKLQVSEHTAKFHVNSILSKLHAGTRTEAVMRGLRKGILKV
jgi:two-component system nitrate/nitrite response regulator NarL